MHRTVFALTLASAVVAFSPTAQAGKPQAADAQPEIQRDLGQAQAVGQVHTLRNIPEACVHLQGQFTGDAAAPYRFESSPRQACAQRARYVEASALKKPPSVATGWILNDVIRVPNAACPSQQAALSIWRRQVDPAKITLDAQGRMRLYMKDGDVTSPTGERAKAVGLYTATLAVSGGCG